MKKFMFAKLKSYKFQQSKLLKVMRSVCILFTFFYAAQPMAQNTRCAEVCDWYSSIYALCQNQDSGWGWENSANCIGHQTCAQQSGDGGVIEQCEDNDDTNAQRCAALDGKTYYSDALYEASSILGSDYYERREVFFSNGEFHATQSHQIVTGNYRCENDHVIAGLPDDDNYIIAFSNDLSDMSFAVSSSAPRAAYSQGTDTAADCRLVAGTDYKIDPDANAGQGSWISFGEHQKVQLGLPGWLSGDSRYNCQTGELHIHRSPTDAKPVHVSIENGGAAIVLQLSASTNWRFLRDDGGSACSALYAPVCAAITNIEPCLSSPCPIQEYRTFGNRCEMNKRSASYIREGECTPNEEGRRIFDLSGEFACAAVYEPVCAKEESSVACITEPCNTHLYQTFGNNCEALAAVTDITWPHQACGDLEDLAVTEEPPVRMVSSLETPQIAPIVINAQIENNILSVSLVYSGCQEQHFDLQVERAFAESFPVQANWAFTPQYSQSCQAEFKTDLVYDLLPLKALYEASYGTDAATIALPGLVEYKINQNQDGDCDLPFTSKGTSITQETVNWSSGEINIACGGAVNVSMLAKGMGPMESADYLNIYYSLDGGKKVALSKNTNAFSEQPVSASNLSGNTLEIFVEGKTSYTDETYTVSNISVTMKN